VAVWHVVGVGEQDDGEEEDIEQRVLPGAGVREAELEHNLEELWEEAVAGVDREHKCTADESRVVGFLDRAAEEGRILERPLDGAVEIELGSGGELREHQARIE
jgi:hypothetical protein